MPLYAVGGANPDNFAEYFAAGCAGFGLGTYIFKPGMELPRLPAAPGRPLPPMTRERQMSDTAELFVDSRCELGEGPVLAPAARSACSGSISSTGRCSRRPSGGIIVDRITFDATVSAAGVIDKDNLAIASAGGSVRLRFRPTRATSITPLEADSPATGPMTAASTRPGGFWIGTMGRKEPGKWPPGRSTRSAPGR